MVSRKPKPQSYDARIFNIPQDETSTTMKDFSPLMCIDGNNWQQKHFSRGGATTSWKHSKTKSYISSFSWQLYDSFSFSSTCIAAASKFSCRFSTQKVLAQAPSLCTTLHIHALWPKRTLGTLSHTFGAL